MAFIQPAHKQSVYCAAMCSRWCCNNSTVSHWQLVISPDLHSKPFSQRGQFLISCFIIFLQPLMSLDSCLCRNDENSYIYYCFIKNLSVTVKNFSCIFKIRLIPEHTIENCSCIFKILFIPEHKKAGY